MFETETLLRFTLPLAKGWSVFPSFIYPLIAGIRTGHLIWTYLCLLQPFENRGFLERHL